MMQITRYVLDAGWVRETSTINNHLLEVNINVIKQKDIGKAPSYPYLGHIPVKEIFGMIPEVEMLMWSLDPGRLSTFAQFNPFGSSWSELSTVWKESINCVIEGSSLGEDHMRNIVLTKCSTQTILFERFVRRVEMRVGSKSKADQTISIEVMKWP